MSSFTIDELKKVLKENNIALPGGKAKKEEYVKLYEEHIALNASLGDTYSSDDENSQSSRKVTSTNTLNVSSSLIGKVETLTSDELFKTLKENGIDAGPVLPTTRKIYEKKLLEVMQRNEEGTYSNGVDDKFEVDPSEISDNESNEIKEVVNKRVTNVGKKFRDSPQPSTSKREPSPYLSDLQVNHETTIPKRFSYIETVPKIASKRIGTNDEPSIGSRTGLYQRATSGHTEESSLGYIGRWSPKLNRNTSTKKPVSNGLLTPLRIFIVAILILAVAGGVYYQWTTNDPYQLIQEHAEDEIKKFAARKSET